MNTNDKRPVNPMLVGGTAFIVMAGLAVLQHCMPFSPGNLYRTWLFLAFIIG